MKVLITGAAGFVGTNLTERLIEKGNEVVGIDSLSRRGSEMNLKHLKDKFPDFNFQQSEIEDAPHAIYKHRPDLVYHFAAQVAVTSSVQNPSRDFLINAKGSFDVARAASEVGAPVIYTSTNKVFGDNVNNVPIKELETRYDFDGELERKGISDSFSIDAAHHTPYGVSKLVGDLYVREFGGIANRCSCMYGPNQHGIVDQGWLSHIAKKIIKGEQVEIYGDGKQVRDVLHSRDVVDLLERQGEGLLGGNDELRGQAFAVGGGYQNTTSLLELCQKWGLEKGDLKFGPWRPADQKVFYCDTSKAKRMFGWEPRVRLDEGVGELYRWTEKNLYA